MQFFKHNIAKAMKGNLFWTTHDTSQNETLDLSRMSGQATTNQVTSTVVKQTG